ncbi:OmpL47-type beta-barrel domain-containing protein [Arthrobacter sp. MMS18-M83]|uniref:OmpL47-type beta-barrel domain-containing protein n=1 Tax=Arthrobacter sp. MMS18-M83 TaxID=2996261 RepID=UPI00227C4124|nr:hypothetical protein [Arthrobacter sp. MMS18-M83]WAH98348.1 hypothetical protein OW521_05650 [Arthrobacter sp. MMS18-M83]
MNRPKHSAGLGSRYALRRRVTWTLLAVLFISWGGPAASAFWQSLSSSNFGAAKADTMPQGGAPVASLNGTNTTVNWAAVATPGGHAVAGYTVARYSSPSGGTKIAAGGGCAGTVSGLSCVEQNLPGGTWYYTVTPVISLWTGAESVRSAGVTVDTTPPTVGVTSISPAPNGAGFNRTSTVTVNLAAVDNTGGSGVANIKYSVDGGTTVTVNAATAAVNVSGGDGTHTVSYFATDVAGNASTPQTQTVKIDTILPVVGVTSISPTPNSRGYYATSPVTVNLGATDVGGSGVASITYQVDTGTQVTVAGATASVSVTGEAAHNISYFATDAAGNSSGSQTQAIAIDFPPTVSSVTLGSGGATAKKADAGDTLTIVFSTDMDPHTLCSGWNSSSPNQTVDGTASIGTDEVLRFTSTGSTTCTAPSFGSVALVAVYNTSTTSPLNFTASTMAWTQSTGTLVITLGGSASGGGVAGTNVQQKTPTYTPSSGAADKAGNPLTGTFTASSPSKF